MRQVLAIIAAALALAVMLGGCAGVPIGRHMFLVLGVGVVRVDRADTAVGVSSRVLGLTLGCRQLSLGVEGSYCAQLPAGDVAIIERGSGPGQHLSVVNLRTMEKP